MEPENGGMKRGVRAARAAELLLAALEAFLILMFCAKASFLYPFNDWTDANCFFTVGKAIVAGKVPYRDIVEQKGLYLYMLHALAALLSWRTFIGVFLVEAAAGAVSVFFIRRILALFCKKASWALAPLVFALICSSTVFARGDSAEELCMPLLLASLWLSMRAMQAGDGLTRKQWFLIGVLAGCVFWIKYSMCTFFLGLVAVPFLRDMKAGNYRGILRAIRQGLLGLAAASAPVLIYFAAHGALGDLWQVYFYDNLFLYSDGIAAKDGGRNYFQVLLAGIRRWGAEYPSCAILLPAGLVWCALTQKSRTTLNLFLIFAATALPVFSICWIYPYYSLILGIFTIFGAACLGQVFEWTFSGPWRRSALAASAAGALAAAVLIACICSPNRSYRAYKKEDLAQYRFADVIDSVPGASVLNYGFLDGGFYTATGTVPPWKYFCKLNCNIPEMMQQQNAYVESGLPDFVVTRNRALDIGDYMLVCTAGAEYDGVKLTYRLYEKTSLLKG